jgi:flagellar motor switch protein FliN
MENWIEELSKYLPDVESFLTSVLLEETKISVVATDVVEKSDALSGVQKTDIFLFSRDEAHNTDILLVLDKEWYGLLSSIMLGIEEKSMNDVTLDLLNTFSSKLTDSLLQRLENEDLNPSLEPHQVLTHRQIEKQLAHDEYFLAKLEIEGLADNNVRAELLLGNPEALNEEEEEQETQEESIEDDAKGQAKQKEAVSGTPVEAGEFAPVDAEQLGEMGTHETVISGRFVEFDDFGAAEEDSSNENSRSMDLLKDVEMDVSVELGRIELPLGKVLQLTKGSVLELEKLAGEPVDILVNGHCIAHGEVVVIDEHFGVRISNLITTKQQRIAGLN